MVFPEGIVIDTKNREYLTSKVNSLFLAKSRYMVSSEGINKKLPIKSDEGSSLVAGVVLFSLRLHESNWGCFTKESLCSLRSLQSFSLHGLASKLAAMNGKSPPNFVRKAFSSSGGRTWTYDLWVMSPTSYQLLHPAIYLWYFVSV